MRCKRYSKDQHMVRFFSFSCKSSQWNRRHCCGFVGFNLFKRHCSCMNRIHFFFFFFVKRREWRHELWRIEKNRHRTGMSPCCVRRLCDSFSSLIFLSVERRSLLDLYTLCLRLVDSVFFFPSLHYITLPLKQERMREGKKIGSRVTQKERQHTRTLNFFLSLYPRASYGESDWNFFMNHRFR